ncbi:MAG: T9SS type A sorting domain-containing protein [Saprospiraceae bacterium]|nr:T9SS type A sorting domain-containing protein [Saprospiraceae bacterium]
MQKCRQFTPFHVANGTVFLDLWFALYLKPLIVPFMLRVILLLTMVFQIAGGLYSQSLWTPIQRDALGQIKSEPNVLPAEGTFYQLDYTAIVKTLQHAQSGYIMLPTSNGNLLRFNFVYSPVYEKGLKEKYPQFGTYTIQDAQNPGNRGRIDYTLKGFHASYTLDGTKIIINPVFRDRTDIYAVYNKFAYHAIPSDRVPFECLHHEHGMLDEEVTAPMGSSSLRSTNVDLLQYRIAVATTGEYALYHGGNVSQVLAEIVTAINRVNDVYEVDLGIRLILIADNDKIIFLDPATDDYTNGSPGIMINQNPTNIGKFISIDDYDIGHVFGVSTASGTIGLASLGSVCTTNKARAMSSYFTPEFDDFYIDVLSHEIGHQFSANHSFNKCDEMNENQATGWEPGSGSTIMSYAGSCGNNNVQDFSDAYFHGGSIETMKYFVTVANGSTCGTAIETANETPLVSLNYSNGFYIPISTPFRLDATASDPNNDNLTYTWEQMDTGPITDAGSPLLNSPLFRTFKPTASPSRTFPQMVRILQNQAPGKYEVLPTYNRDMTFRVTVRDNNPEAGAVAQADVAFKATNLAGPFVVTSFNSVDTVYQGEYSEITWNPANTDQPPVNSKCVNIRLSTDGGLNFNHLLADNVPNTGSFFVTYPKVGTTSGRVQIEAADNIFFDVSNANLRILAAQQAGYTMDIRPFKQIKCIPETATWTISTESLLNFAEEITWSVQSGLPAGATVSFSQNQTVPPATIEMTMDLSQATETGSFDLVVRGESAGGQVLLRPVTIDVYRADYSTLDAVSPVSGASSVSTSPLLTWVPQADATSYTVEVATSPAFGGSTIVSQGGITNSQYQLIVALQESTLYYWRVTPVNICGTASNVPVYAFHTFTLSCAESSSATEYNIPSQGTSVTESPINLVTSGNVGTLRIKNITGTHQNIGNLRGSLKGPAGKTVRLFNPQCFFIGGSINFGVNDDSQIPVSCPPDNGENYKSVELLAGFTGDPLSGTWSLVIEDLVSGSGGKITGWTLEYCADVALNPPSLVINDTLFLKPGGQKTITNNQLHTTDPDNGPSELMYTIVRNPVKGTLSKTGTTLNVGDRFTQQEINDGLIEYQHGTAAEETDNFLFTVEDGAGGWVGIVSFGIRTDESVFINQQRAENLTMDIWPNPAGDEVRIRLIGLSIHPDRVSVFNQLGQEIATSVTVESAEQIRLNTMGLPSGLYFIRLRVDQGFAIGKLRIAH